MGPPPMRDKSRSRSKRKAQSKEQSAGSQLNLDHKTSDVLKHKGYSLKQKLGAGAYGVVYKAVLKDGSLSAVKILDYNKMSKKYQERFLPREMEALILSKHENVIQVFDIFRAHDYLFIFMEFAGGGDIAGAIKKSTSGTLGLKKAGNWFYQIASGLQYFHTEVKMCHRDIKLDNFLLNSEQKAKLSDFGFAKCIINDQNSVSLSSTFCGTLPYESPQILEKQTYNGFKYDVWSMGVSLYIMITSHFPFHYKNEHNKPDVQKMLEEQKDHPNYINGRMADLKIPSRAQELLCDMLHPSENDRPKMEVVVNNSWLRKIANNSTI